MVVALACALVLLVGAFAICLRRGADALRQAGREFFDCGGGRAGVQLGHGLADYVVDGPLPPFEGGVVLRYLALRVVGVPAVDVYGDDFVDGGEVEHEPAFSISSRPLVRETVLSDRVSAETTFSLAAKCSISYDTGTPNRLSDPGVAARFAKSPNKYSVLSSRPLKVRVMSMRPKQSSDNREELTDLACVWSAGEMKLSRNLFCRL